MTVFYIGALWRPRIFSVTYQLWRLHYMQINTPASVFIVELRSNTGSWARSIVGSDRPALRERISEFSPQPGSLAEQKIKCHADDSRCQNTNYSQTLWWNTSNSSGRSWLTNARTTSLKRVFEKPFFLLFLTDSVHYFQPNTFFSAL